MTNNWWTLYCTGVGFVGGVGYLLMFPLVRGRHRHPKG